VLIVESDDWGAGPLSQAEALNRLIDSLARFKDCDGRHPVMTLALILAVPNGKAISTSGRYFRMGLGESCFESIRGALESGQNLNVFSLLLHGLEHYWPETLMAAAEPNVRQWLTQDEPPATELLAPHYQSRWIDTGVLPSLPHSPEDIAAAVEHETALFAELLGQRAKVAVPPTFIWTEEVERAWARHGVEVVVTPGRRYSCRNEKGSPDCPGPLMYSGDRGVDVTYVVRNDYFEPHKGHTAERGLDALQRRTRQGRACLLETHRINFIGAGREVAFAELERLMEQALLSFPGVRFMNTLELGRALLSCPESAIESRGALRIAAWVARSEELPRFCKLGQLTGILLIMQLAAAIAKRVFGRGSQ